MLKLGLSLGLRRSAGLGVAILVALQLASYCAVAYCSGVTSGSRTGLCFGFRLAIRVMLGHRLGYATFAPASVNALLKVGRFLGWTAVIKVTVRDVRYQSNTRCPIPSHRSHLSVI